jgi:hypothetical protein
MTKHLVEKIRIAYSTGKYDKLSLFLENKNVISADNLMKVLDFTVFPDVKSELKQRIEEVPLAQELYSKYQTELRALVKKAEAAELSGNKHFPYQESAVIIKDLLVEELSKLGTIKFEDLRGFYLEDEGHEG